MQRLGKNAGRYFGERIDIPRVLAEIDQCASACGWESKPFLEIAGLQLKAYRRPAGISERVPRIYISSGMHGDEPAGPLAMLQLFRENHWRDDLDFSIVPCLNPTGFVASTRENAQGIDINRDYRHFETAEARAHSEWLQRQPPFDLALLLHEDWEANGFYVYELNPHGHPSLAQIMVNAARSVCPIETANLVDNWPAQEGIISPKINPAERPQWPEAIYLISGQSRQNYTLEAPSDFSMATRMAALVAAVKAAVAAFGSVR